MPYTHIHPPYLSHYVTYVCPLRKVPRECLQTLRAPPLNVQKSIDDLIEMLPYTMRGPVMDALTDDRPEDAQYLINHLEEYETIQAIVDASNS